MAANNKTQTAPTFTLKLEAIALMGVSGICLLIYLSLIAVLLISSGKVANAPAPPPGTAADHAR